MTESPETSTPSRPDDGLGWLDVSHPYTWTLDGDQVTVECPEGRVEAVIEAAPPCRRLTISCHSRLVLSLAPDVEIGDDFVLRLEFGDDAPTYCEVSAALPSIVCAADSSLIGRSRPRLMLGVGAHIAIASGNWTIRALQGGEADQISLAVDNTQLALDIHSGIPISSLNSAGDHDYNVILRREATVALHEGTATFHQPLHTVSVSGNGSIRALGNVVESRVDLSGDLTASREIKSCEILLGGDLEATGPVKLEQNALRCGNALFNATLDTDGVVECIGLDVKGSIRGSGQLTVATLACAGEVAAERITATGDISIREGVECEVLEGGGGIDLHGMAKLVGALRWMPKRSQDRLALRWPRMVVPSVSVTAPGVADVAPALVLRNGIEITELRVDTPCLSIAVEPEPDSDSRKAEATIAARLMRADCSIHLTHGSLRCRLVGDVPPMGLRADVGTKIEVEKIPDDLPSVSLRGDGELRFDDSDSTARLKCVDVVGRMKFGCTADIGNLSVSPWPLTSPEAGAGDDNLPPRVDLGPKVVVRCASGICRLDNLGAKIDGDPRDGLAVTSISSPSNDPTDGHLTNVDVSRLPDDQIPSLRQVRVLELSGKSLKRFAGERTPLRCKTEAFRRRWLGATSDNDENGFSESLTHETVRSRGETAAQLADILGGKVNSGASRAWLHWAVARLQHRGLNRGAAEKVFRACYRLVGYGYRPVPALLTWAAVALAGLLYAWCVGYAGEPADIEFGWQWIERYIEILLLPISYLRLGGAGATQILKPTAVDLVSRLLIGLPFLFAVLSIRQYFRSPVGLRGRSGTSEP